MALAFATAVANACAAACTPSGPQAAATAAWAAAEAEDAAFEIVPLLLLATDVTDPDCPSSDIEDCCWSTCGLLTGVLMEGGRTWLVGALQGLIGCCKAKLDLMHIVCGLGHYLVTPLPQAVETKMFVCVHPSWARSPPHGSLCTHKQLYSPSYEFDRALATVEVSPLLRALLS